MITDLTNTSWVIKENFVAYPSAYVGTYTINFSLYNAAGVLQSSNRKYLQIGIFTTGTITSSTARYENSVNAYSTTQGQFSPSSRQSVEPGCKIIFTGGNDVTNKSLIAWLSQSAQQVEVYSIDFDDEWVQKDCHWELNRFFRLTWNVADGKNLYYRLGGFSSRLSDYKSIDSSKVYTKRDSYIYELPLAAFTTAELIAARDSDGWITLTVYNGSTYKTFSKFYLLELPPIMVEPEAPLKNIRTELVTYNPGEVILSWDRAKELDNSDAENSPDSLDGYCIELFHRPSGAASFTQVKGITLVKGETEPEEGVKLPVFKLVKVSNYSDDTFTELPEDKEELKEFLQSDLSFKHAAANVENTEDYLTVEAYMELSKAIEYGIDLTVPKFYFTPKNLGIMPGDSYKFIIYPYSHYEGALIGTKGAEHTEGTSKGVVRVKTADSWVEGQVWVCVSAPVEPNKVKWVQAEAIYAMADDGTGKGVWKEAQ